MQRLSGSLEGFGGDLRFGEVGLNAGLRGADKICTTIATQSLPSAGHKTWRAFLSTSSEHARDRIGQGPWHDRRGRLVAESLDDLLQMRPRGAEQTIANDLPNEHGVPNRNPSGTGRVDNHDVLTGSSADGTLYGEASESTCDDWTSRAPSGRPRIGHSWPRDTVSIGTNHALRHWISAHDAGGCAPGFTLVELGPPDANNPTVGASGGYGGIYCFAVTPN